MEDIIKSLRERCKRTVLRRMESGEVYFDKVKRLFMYKETEEEYKVDLKEGAGDDSDGSDSDEEPKPKKKTEKAKPLE